MCDNQRQNIEHLIYNIGGKHGFQFAQNKTFHPLFNIDHCILTLCL